MTWAEAQDRLIAYTEGVLSPADRAAFEAELARSPELRAMLDVMRRADASLGRQFALPASVAAAPAAVASIPGRAVRERSAASWGRWGALVGGAIAASILLVLTLQFVNDRYLRTNPTALTVSKYFDGVVQNGMTPDYVCKDDAEFVEYSRKAFGLPLLAQGDASVEIIGWTGYGDTLRRLGVSTQARVILARVEGRPAIVIIDRADAGAPGPELDPAGRGRLNLFARQLDGLELYEVTPLSKPAALDRFSMQPDL